MTNSNAYIAPYEQYPLAAQGASTATTTAKAKTAKTKATASPSSAGGFKSKRQRPMQNNSNVV